MLYPSGRAKVSATSVEQHTVFSLLDFQAVSVHFLFLPQVKTW